MQTCRIAPVKLKNIIKNQPNLFWAFHLGGWALWGIFGKYFYTTAILGETVPNYAAYVAIITVIGMLLALCLRYLYHFLWNRAIWLQVIGLIGGSSVAGWLWIRARSFIYGNWFETAKDMADWYAEVGEDVAEIYEKVSFFSSNASPIASACPTCGAHTR